ncbi:hypothetical protein [Streptomyces sp. MBT60]|nr:hypothetical protein [Streptomyces sp. MBT60]
MRYEAVSATAPVSKTYAIAISGEWPGSPARNSSRSITPAA